MPLIMTCLCVMIAATKPYSPLINQVLIRNAPNVERKPSYYMIKRLLLHHLLSMAEQKDQLTNANSVGTKKTTTPIYPAYREVVHLRQALLQVVFSADEADLVVAADSVAAALAADFPVAVVLREGGK